MEVDKEMKNIVEAALFASNEPLDADRIKRLLQCEAEQLKSIIKELQVDYAERGVELSKVASGYRFQVRQTYSGAMQKLHEKNSPRYSRALLETLALIAYRQPVTRGEIEEVRGIAVSTQIMKTLLERDWIKIVGHRDAPGKPALFATTKQFLDYFNLHSLADLPPLREITSLQECVEELSTGLRQANLEFTEEHQPNKNQEA